MLPKPKAWLTHRKKTGIKTRPVCCPIMLILVWLSHYVYRGCFYTQACCCPIILTLSATSIHKHKHQVWLLSHYFGYKYTQTHTQGLVVVPLYVSWVAQVLAAALARLSVPSSYSPPNQRARGSPVCTRGGHGGDTEFAPGGRRRILPRGAMGMQLGASRMH